MCRLPVPEGTKTVTEGKATILHQGDNVFYNPAQVGNYFSQASVWCGLSTANQKILNRELPLQVINRDLSVAVLRYFVKQRREEIENGTLKAPRQKRTPAEAIQLKEAGGAGALACKFDSWPLLMVPPHINGVMLNQVAYS